MNKNLEKAMENTLQLKALLHSLENIAIDLEFKPECAENADEAMSLLFMSGDILKSLSTSLDELGRDAQICNVFMHAREVHINA